MHHINLRGWNLVPLSNFDHIAEVFDADRREFVFVFRFVLVVLPNHVIPVVMNFNSIASSRRGRRHLNSELKVKLNKIKFIDKVIKYVYLSIHTFIHLNYNLNVPLV